MHANIFKAVPHRDILLWETDGPHVLSCTWDGQTGQCVCQLAWAPTTFCRAKCQLGSLWHPFVWMSLGLGGWETIHHHSILTLCVLIAKVVGTLPARGLNTSLNHFQAQQWDAISWLRLIPGAMTLEDSASSSQGKCRWCWHLMAHPHLFVCFQK